MQEWIRRKKPLSTNFCLIHIRDQLLHASPHLCDQWPFWQRLPMTLSEIKPFVAALKDAEQLDLLNWLIEYLGPSAIQRLRRELSSKEKGSEIEDFIATIVGGKRTINGFAYDVDSANGSRLEVKYARFSSWKGKYENTRNWTWDSPLGEKGEKFYDRLILVGEPYDEWRSRYKDPSARFVLFDIPFGEVSALMTSEAITLNANPSQGRQSILKVQAMWKIYQVTELELKSCYG